ncbi:MAG: hypothetical protein KatS3mg003_1371 [Candidatus Nitrosocaldaceae archaeon]|nr:MAG: hypothetical protein KatS3mg003_1371 [Candidatus Nitrosocaldaceae archaeon]
MLNDRKIIILSIVLIIPIINAYAHPFLMESEPGNFEQLASSPDKVIITYSEPVEEGFSYIRVTDSNGNRVDNDDTQYFEGDETKLVVSLKPNLPDDVYTVNTKVLSKVDGHIVDYTFSFIVGEANVEIPTAQEQSQQRIEAIYTPESLARFPGLVGQYIIVGIGFGSIYIWRSSIKDGSLKYDLAKIVPILNVLSGKLYIIGIILVIASSFAMLIVQATTLGIGFIETIGTGFGNIVLVRLIISFIAAGIYPLVKKDNDAYKIIILLIGFALLATISLMGHGAAVSPLVTGIDMLHNALAAIWIGTIFYLAFSVMPSLKRIEADLRTAMISLIIPRFSKVTVVALGILAVTGPSLLFFIETDLNLLLSSSYGMLLAVKLALIGVMLGAGAFNQFEVHRKAINLIISLNNKTYQDPDHVFSRSIHKRFTSALRIEAAIGIIVLLSIAFLTNAGLPRSEFPFYTSDIGKLGALSVSIDNDLPRLYNSTQLVEDAKVNLSFEPARVGINTFSIKISDKDGNPMRDIADGTIKLRQIGSDISPLVIPLNKVDAYTYIANGTITANGKWVIEVNIDRTEALSISTIFPALIKPDLDEMKFELTEYDMPFDTLNPVHAIYKDNSIWTSDGSKPRLWRFDLNTQEFKSYTFNGTSSIKLAEDSKGRIWFTDPLSRQIGYFDPSTERFKMFDIYQDGLPTDIYVDFNDNVWLALIDIDTIAKFDPDNEQYITYKIPINGSQPAAIVMDDLGNVWIAEAAGRLAKLMPNGDIEEYGSVINDGAVSGILAEPFALLISDDGAIWISEHIGPKLTRFDPLLKTFQSFRAIDDKSLPYGMAQDNFGNIWFAQHVLDKIGVLDPMTGKIREVEISSPAWVQFLDIDDNGNIWFAEPRQAKIAMISIKTLPTLPKEEEQNIEVEEEQLELRYADVAVPAMSGFIVATSLLFVKAVYDLRSSIKHVDRFRASREDKH